MRVFTAGLGAETGSFGALCIGIEDFRETCFFGPGEHPDALTEVSAPLIVLRRRRALSGWEVIEGSWLFALPGGPVAREVYESLRDRILEELRAALPVDAVALSLHGAMCAIGYDDCEGDLLARVRAIVGPRVAVGAELDPHAHLSPRMTEKADILIAMREYPHTDFLARAEELIDLLAATVVGGARPVTAVFDCAMIGRFHTSRQPMRGFVDRLEALIARTPGLLTASLIHGFPWGDVPDMGVKVLAVADGDARLAAQVAATLGAEVQAIGASGYVHPVGMEAGLDEALSGPGPVVVADVSDNPGGGASGDGTTLLRALIARDVEACLGPLWDPMAVRAATSAGAGAVIPLRVGGKAGPWSGAPFDGEARILATSPELFQSWAGTKVSLGAAAAVRMGRVDIVLSSIRDQAYGPDLFSNLRVDPAARRIVAVKSAQHFLHGFGPLARSVVLVGGGGPLEVDFRKVPYRNIRRPKWPLDDLPGYGAPAGGSDG
jgi:microcystin degradation protein MlrC